MTSEVYFEDLENRIKEQLSLATNYVKIAIAWITLKNYESLFYELINKGVKIEIIISDSYELRSHQMSIVKNLENRGIQITICTMPSSRNYMHHKFAVIDDEVVINGSFNWSANAAKSFENLMIIKNEEKVVRAFLLEFSKIEKLNKNAIKSLHSLQNCKCGGKKVNLLVFDSSPMEMTYEMWGDVISYCVSCDAQTTLQTGIQDTSLALKFSSYELIDDDYFTKLSIDREIDEHLTGYSIHGHILHGIGFVGTQFSYPNDWFVTTTIRWKNKFVAKYIEDDYQTNFNVNYH